jgi:2-keto-4-pentenoate hydratase/2-oxohepta-3-ene-1,7-dioic acid hydratase in catechol pathway
MWNMTEELEFDSGNKFVSLGGVFSTHTDSDRPKKWPDVWIVPKEAVVHEEDPIKLPPEVEDVVVGPEITAVIGKEMWSVPETDVADSIAGFTVSTDVTVKGEWPGYANENHPHITGTGYKIFPTFRPTLSLYEPLDINEATDLSVEASVDGEVILSGSTSEMGFTVQDIFTHVSKIIKLNPGDIVALGDPGNPEGYIDNGSEVTSTIESIGSLTNPVERLNE